TPPNVSIISPTNNSTVNTSSITVTGTASDPSGVSSVTVNGVNAQTTNSYSNWTANVTLTEGANTLNIRAVDSRNNIANSSITVTYTVPVGGSTIWAEKNGTASLDYAFSVAMDSRSNCDGLGGTDCFVIAGQSNYGAYLAKYNSSRTLLWQQPLSLGSVNDVVIDSQGNIFITGNFYGGLSFGNGVQVIGFSGYNAFVAKYSSTGLAQWAKWYGNDVFDDLPFESGEGIALDSSGNIYVTGTMISDGVGTVNLGCETFTGSRSFIIKLNSSGSCIWSKSFAGSHWFEDIVTDSFGNVYVTGSVYGSATFGVTTISNTGQELFIVKYNSSGVLQWVRDNVPAGAQATNSRGYSLSLDSTGNVYVTGFFTFAQNFGGSVLTPSGPNDIILAKYRVSDGGHVWSKRFGGPGGGNVSTTIESGHGVTVNSDGSVFLVGKTAFTPIDLGAGAQVSSGIGYKIFASKYDSLGNYVWGRIIASSAGYAWSNTVTLDIAGNPIVVGNFTGIIDLAGSTLTSSGGFDIFIWKLAK
ncbi:MAG TPA: SBBP repeat-containing protein, partial [Candidatus Paceibacterota bacterium]